MKELTPTSSYRLALTNGGASDAERAASGAGEPRGGGGAEPAAASEREAGERGDEGDEAGEANAATALSSEGLCDAAAAAGELAAEGDEDASVAAPRKAPARWWPSTSATGS